MGPVAQATGWGLACRAAGTSSRRGPRRRSGAEARGAGPRVHRQSVDALVGERDAREVRAGMDDEVVLHSAGGGTVDDVNPVPRVLVDDLRVVPDTRAPAGGGVPEKEVRPGGGVLPG